MINLSTYINNSEIDNIDESLWIVPTLKYVGTILLSTVVPYLISIGVRVASLKIDDWLKDIIEKHPQYKKSIMIISDVLKDDMDKCKKCKQLIMNIEHQKNLKHYNYDLDVYKNEIINCIQSDEDKKKVEDLIDFIKSDSDKFKNDID